MPSERALRAARLISTNFELGWIPIDDNEAAELIDSEYADLEAYVEYVNKKIEELNRSGFIKITPSTFSIWKGEFPA